jgi:hypothetical protein
MVAAGIGLQHAYRAMAEDDAAYPATVMLTDDSKLIHDRAVELAKDRREDLDAVGELTRLARGKTRDLKAAARSLRMFGQYQEDPIANRAFRLLQAATLGTGVQPVSPHQMAVMDRIAELGGGSLQDHFAKLVELEPRLARLADQARSGRFGRFPAMPETGVVSPEPLLAAAAAANEVRQRIKIVLVPLVGPEAASQDVVLRSFRAQIWATNYLEQLTSECPPASGQPV